MRSFAQVAYVLEAVQIGWAASTPLHHALIRRKVEECVSCNLIYLGIVNVRGSLNYQPWLQPWATSDETQLLSVMLMANGEFRHRLSVKLHAV